MAPDSSAGGSQDQGLLDCPDQIDWPGPRRASRFELLRAALDVGLGVPRLGWYLATRRRHEAAVARDLATDPAPVESPELPPLPAAPLRLFLAAAEPSGEAHAARLARAILRLAAEHGAPAPELRGLGGDELRAAGVETLADPGSKAAMGTGALRALPFYTGLIESSAACWANWRPHVFVPVDSPALFVPMARTAQRYGVPTVHHIAPGFWAWAPWRVTRYRRHIQRALTILPFEPAWFARHGVPTGHVGHPLLDALAQLPAPPPADDPARDALILLPGSRAHEIDDNLPWMLRVVERLRRTRPDLPVRVLQSSERHRERIAAILAGGPSVEERYAELHPELSRGRVVLAVSGTVLTDVLHHRLPTTAIYRDTGVWKARGQNLILTTGSFATTNLVAGERIVPEHLFRGDGPLDEVADWLNRAWDEPQLRSTIARGLERAAERLGPAGAAERAARFVLRAAAEQASARTAKGTH